MSQAELEALYARLEKPLYNVVYRWVWNRDEARDIVQEAFLRLWRMGERVEPGKAEPLVYRVAVNLAASRRRTRKVWKLLSLEALREARAAERPADESLAREERLGRVRHVVEALPEDLRRTVVLCECTELSYEEVGAILGVPAGTVGSRRHRALKLLRAKLAGEVDVGERRSESV
jgi:RNA polymerase sigma-70 factor (ECF subfamily)